MNILTILDDIYDRVDTENTKKEMQLFDKTLDEFESICSFNVNLFDNSINTVIYYKNEAYIGKKNLNTLYRILIKNGYLVESDISYIINLLCYSNFSKSAIESALRSPYIEKIDIEGSRVYLHSHLFGTISFMKATDYIGSSSITEYANKRDSLRNCHNNCLLLASMYPTLDSVTSICRSYFNLGYYHSYLLDSSNDLVIDLSSNVVMDKSAYEKIFFPSEITRTLNSDIESRYQEILDSEGIKREDNSTNKILFIALYELYKKDKELGLVLK